MKFGGENMNKKYSLRVLLEGRVDFGNFTFSIDTNSPVAKAIRAESEETVNLAEDEAAAYFDADENPVSRKRNKLGNIIMLDMLRAGFNKSMGDYGSQGRNASIAAGGMAEELVRAAFNNATSLNVLSFSNNEPFADVQVGNEYISVKFSGEPGSSKIKAKQLDDLEASVKNKGSDIDADNDKFSVIEIGITNTGLDITKLGPVNFNEFKDAFKNYRNPTKTTAEREIGKFKVEDIQQTRISIVLPGSDFFNGLPDDFITGVALARETATATDGEVPESQRTSSGAYGHVGDNLADRIAAFVTKTGDKGRDAIKYANAIQKLLIKATNSVKASGKNVDDKKLEDLKEKLKAALDLVDNADGVIDKELDLSVKSESVQKQQRQDEVLARKLFEWAVK